MLKKNQKLFYLSTIRILQFIKISPFFQAKRHEYEQEIVKWQIWWMRIGGENWIVDEECGGDLNFLTSMVDLGFRKGVVDTLSNIGMDIDAIEEGIEKNADMWRDLSMNNAFSNAYEPILCNLSGYLDNNDESDEERKTLEPVDSEFEEKWLKMRKYEYYQRHKDSVDKYGIVEPDMKLSKEEVVELKIYLEQKHHERMTQIEQYNSETQKRSRTLRRLN